MPEITNSTELLFSLQTRAEALLDELEAFEAFLKSRNSQDGIEVRHFKNNVQSEVKSLARVNLVQPDENAHEMETEDKEARRLHMLHSTNLPFYEAIWSAAKKCEGIQALGKRMHWIPPTESESCSGATNRHVGSGSKNNSFRPQRKSVLIDIVAKGGLEWVKVSTITAKRLLFEIAREGWENYADLKEDFEGELSSEKPDLELVKLARDMHSASLQVRVQYQHPQVRLLLPKLTKGKHIDVDAVLEDHRDIGVVVECGGDLETDRSEAKLLRTKASAVFSTMLLTPAKPLTGTILNVDYTLLLALILDISHVPPLALLDASMLPHIKQSYHSAILRQIRAEETLPLLLSELHPVLVGRDLVCTGLAAKRALEIVSIMGTSSEKMRADLFLGQEDPVNTNQDDLRRSLQQYSIHSVPDDLQVRISQIDFGPDAAFGNVTAQPKHNRFPVKIAQSVVEVLNLSAINCSVFLYSWCNDIVTLTSNQAVAVHLEQAINAVLDDLEQASCLGGKEGMQKQFLGPRIWVCETARSLIGKHKADHEASDS